MCHPSLENSHRTDQEVLEAPPGFEPGIEVLQTGPKRLSCCLVLLPGRPSPLVFPGVRAQLFPICSQLPDVTTVQSNAAISPTVLAEARSFVVVNSGSVAPTRDG